MTEDHLTFLATSQSPHCSLRLDKHLVGYCTIQFMSEGAVELAYGDDWHTLSGGAWFWPAYPGPRLRFHVHPPHETWNHRHVGFQGALVARWAAAGLWPDGPQRAPETRDWSSFFDQIIAQVRRQDKWGRLRAVNLLEQLLVELAEARAQPGSDDQAPWLETVLACLAVSPDNAFAPDYDALAASVGMGVSTLRRRFKAEMGGITLHEHVIQNRIARARTLLTETDLPLRLIAREVGYDTEYFFARQFRQWAGVAPGVYRRSRLR